MNLPALKDLKIGILFTVYNCENYLENCLNPWFELRKDYNIVFSATSGMFSDYITLGIPYRNEKTLEILSKYDIDFLITTKGKNTLKEDQSRNLALNYLTTQNCDLIWVMDGDEVYTKNQIINIIDFIYRNPDPDWYYVNFKNFTINDNLFYDFVHARIVWNNRYGGISYYFFDNEFTYNDGTPYDKKIGLEIPKNVAYIDHFSWLSNDSRSLDKIQYQKFRYCGLNGDIPMEYRCGYAWDNIKNRLTFNKKNWDFEGLNVPILHEELTCFNLDFTTSFSRRNNRIDISKVQREINAEFQIYNGVTDQLIYSTKILLSKDVNYYIAPSSVVYDDEPDFYNFKLKVYENNYLIHHEKIHLKLL